GLDTAHRDDARLAAVLAAHHLPAAVRALLERLLKTLSEPMRLLVRYSDHAPPRTHRRSCRRLHRHPSSIRHRSTCDEPLHLLDDLIPRLRAEHVTWRGLRELWVLPVDGPTIRMCRTPCTKIVGLVVDEEVPGYNPLALR